MRNNQNKHGPDVDVGLRHTWLRKPDVLTGLPPPWKATNDRCGPEDWPPGRSISQKRRRWRPGSTIVSRRTGESPPGIVDDLITSNIDSFAQKKGTDRGCNFAGAQTTIWSVMGGLWPEVRDRKTKRQRD